MKSRQERKVLILLHVVLFIIGGCLGGMIAWQIYASSDITFHKIIVYMSYFALIVLIGGAMSLSARMFLSLARNILGGLRKKFSSVNAMDITGIVIGVVIGIMATLVVELLLQKIISVLVIRVVIDAIFGVIIAVVAGYSCLRWLALDSEIQEVEQPSPLRNTKGYLLTRGALADSKIVRLCVDYLESNIYTTSTLADTLAVEFEMEEKSIESINFNKLYIQGVVKVVQTLASQDEMENTLKVASSKKLKVIATKKERVSSYNSGHISVLLIDEL